MDGEFFRRFRLLISTAFFISSPLFSFSIFDFLQKTKPTTLQQALDLLKNDIDATSYFSQFTVMENSQSLQRENPRVMMFSGKDKVVITWTKPRENSSRQSIEVLFQDTKTKKLVFQEIVIKNKEIFFSQPNPNHCTSCHGSGYSREIVTPIWSSYNRWPGAFGDFDDEIKKGLESFEKLKSDLFYGRWLSFGEGAFPYWQKIADRKLSRMPNTRLGILLSRMFYKQTSHLLRHHLTTMNATAVLETMSMLLFLNQRCDFDLLSEEALDSFQKKINSYLSRAKLDSNLEREREKILKKGRNLDKRIDIETYGSLKLWLSLGYTQTALKIEDPNHENPRENSWDGFFSDEGYMGLVLIDVLSSIPEPQSKKLFESLYFFYSKYPKRPFYEGSEAFLQELEKDFSILKNLDTTKRVENCRLLKNQF